MPFKTIKQMMGAKRSTRTEAQPCLYCQAPLDVNSSVDHTNDISEGCIAICFKCGHIMAYDAQLKYRELNDEEIKDIAGDKHVVDLVNKAGEVRLRLEAEKEAMKKLEIMTPKISIAMRFREYDKDPKRKWAAIDINTWEPGEPIGTRRNPKQH